MRLWHQALIEYLPRQQLLGQHRECCALRGMGWGKKHATVDYVFDHSIERLYAYHFVVMETMINRGYKVDKSWFLIPYRGKKLLLDASVDVGLAIKIIGEWVSTHDNIYIEHDNEYLKECLDNLRNKDVLMDEEKIIMQQTFLKEVYKKL